MVDGTRIGKLNTRGRVWCIVGPVTGESPGKLQTMLGFISPNTKTIISGKGKKFEDMSRALGLTVKFTRSVFGSDDLNETADQVTIINELNQYEEGTVVLTDRSCLETLGVTDVKENAVYMIKGCEVIISRTLETVDETQ